MKRKTLYIFERLHNYTISKVQRIEKQKERRAGLKIQGECTQRDSPTSFQKSSYYISAHRDPFQGGTRTNVPMEIFAFLDRAVLTVLFVVRLLSLNSLTFHSLDASAYDHLSLSLSLLFSNSSLFSLFLLLYLVSPPTRAGTSRAHRSVRSPFETHA